MKTYTKKIIIIIVSFILLILIITGMGLIKNTGREPANEENNGIVKNTKKQIFLDTDSIARSEKEHITIREAVIKIFYDYPDNVGTNTVIDGKTFFLVGYNHGHRPDTGLPTGGGVMVFEKTSNGKLNLFWESKEYIDNGASGFTRFQDLTNDGIPEIVVEDSPGASGSTTSFLVYAWRDGTFRLITPAEHTFAPNREVIQTKIGGDNAETYIKDIDNDKVMEIIGGYISDTDHMLHQEIYKYNGTEYYLWKKEIKKANQ